jgi:hypothetical protein
MKKENHKQTVVKVNVPVDRLIAPLVEAINSHRNVFTVDSCQGNKNELARVAFTIDGTWEELGRFAHRLSILLGKDRNAEDIPFSLSLEWYAGGSGPLAYLRVPRQHIQAMADSIKSVFNSKSTRS